MKVLPFKIPKPDRHGLIYQEDYELLFYDKFHQHEEIQISFIVNGYGTLIVGDTVSNYNENDVLVIGSNLPHVFKSDTKYGKKSLMISLFFNYDSFGKDFFNLEELKELNSFFERSVNGFKVNSTSNELNHLFSSLKSSSKLEQFMLFLKLISILANEKHTPLSSYVYNKNYTDLEGKRMGNIMEYTMDNYQESITLDHIATVANMTNNAFCKYFKKRTNKTYFKFLNELRIEQASKSLVESKDLTIAEIAEQTGFNNISNFNRQFKIIKNESPREYKKRRLN